MLFLALFPIAPTISDSGDHRFVVVIAQMIATVIFQQFVGKKLKSNWLLSINLWISMMIQTVICVSELMAMSPPAWSIYITWACFILSWVAPFCELKTATGRFFAISTSTFIVYTLLSTFYEGLFFIVLCMSLYMWINVETTRPVSFPITSIIYNFPCGNPCTGYSV